MKMIRDTEFQWDVLLQNETLFYPITEAGGGNASRIFRWQEKK